MTDPIFVIQHHLATADHYDVRFEIDGVLVSWAVPKGPSTDPRVRRLAKRTGDHELAYADYEGVLSTQRRGGGVVQVWDRGTFRNISQRGGEPISAADALDAGHLSVEVAGVKISGGYTLIRTGSDMWLLIKHKGAGADPSSDLTTARPESVLTGRTLAEIAAAESPEA